MSFSVAIVGFRHQHIFSLIKHLNHRDDVRVVAVCEEDEPTRLQLLDQGVFAQLPDVSGERVYSSYPAMLDAAECDIIAVGDSFGKRGARIIESLKRGKHVLGDKPLCTRIEELDAITALAHARHLAVGCQLDLRDSGNFIGLRQLVQAGEIGEVGAVSFGGQHPLFFGTRPNWYFEPEEHGGTLNDIAVHAFDFVPWITGLEFSQINVARTWNAGFAPVPHFHNAAQIMMTLSNGAGVLGDVSYLAPDSLGYALPQYWRTTLWGSEGMAETSYTTPGVTLYKNGETSPHVLVTPTRTGGYLDDFLAEVRGDTKAATSGRLTTEIVLRANRTALISQLAAQSDSCNIPLP